MFREDTTKSGMLGDIRDVMLISSETNLEIYDNSLES